MSDTKISFVQSKAFFYSAVVHIAILLMVILSTFLKTEVIQGWDAACNSR